jgi:hypothetical protein
MVNIFILKKFSYFYFNISGGYSLEPVGSFRWTILAIASFRFYHYFVLQPVSLVCILEIYLNDFCFFI